MKLYSENDSYKIYNGDMLDMLQVIESESIDAIVCDPPYELGFMNKSWDSTGIAFKKETWQNCFEVLKPGGYLLAFGGSRTYHRIACAIEDAGFEIRDCVMYLYGTGFPKSYNIGNQIEAKVLFNDASGRSQKKLQGQKVEASMWTHHWSYENGKEKKDYSILSKEKVIDVEYQTELGKQWQGWGTCLKPAYEPIIVARKPFKGSVVDNIIKYRVGGINIDGCKIGNEKRTQFSGKSNGRIYSEYSQKNAHFETVEGRFPANVITDGSEEVAKGMPNTTSTPIAEESAMRYFYSAKASKKDRDEGLDAFQDKTFHSVLNQKNGSGDRLDGAKTPIRKNNHPTCKPTELMQYLVRLVSPKGATILDPFMGSGSTGKAVMFENRERDANYKFIGIELTDEYLPIAQARIEYARDKFKYDLEQEKVTKGKQNIFDFMESEK